MHGRKLVLTQCAIADQDFCVKQIDNCRELKRNAGLRGYAPSRRIAWLVYGSHKFAGPVLRMRRGLDWKKCITQTGALSKSRVI